MSEALTQLNKMKEYYMPQWYRTAEPLGGPSPCFWHGHMPPIGNPLLKRTCEE